MEITLAFYYGQTGMNALAMKCTLNELLSHEAFSSLAMIEKWGIQTYCDAEIMENKTLVIINKVGLTISYTWKIKYDELKEKTVGSVVKHDFAVDFLDLEWRLSIYPKDTDVNSVNHIGLFLYLMGSNKFPVTADVEFHILNAEEISKIDYGFNHSFPKQAAGNGTHKFILFNDLIDKNLLVNNNLIILCNIYAQTQVGSAEKEASVMCELNLNNLREDLQKIMKQSSFSDITLNICGQKLKAHKIILSACSPVFAALFNSNMKGAIQNEVNIDNVELDVFKEMLRFMYSGKVKNFGKLAYELFSLSDTYELEHLKNICGSVLYKNLTIDSTVDIFLLVNQHSTINFKNKVLEFIVRNIKPIVNLEKFKNMEQTYPSLTIEIYRSVVTR